MQLEIESLYFIDQLRVFSLCFLQMRMSFEKHTTHIIKFKSHCIETTMSLLSKLFSCPVDRHHFMLLMGVILVHTGNAEWHVIVRTIKSNDVIMVQAALGCLREEDCSYRIDRVLDIFMEAFLEFGQVRHLKQPQGLAVSIELGRRGVMKAFRK